MRVMGEERCEGIRVKEQRGCKRGKMGERADQARDSGTGLGTRRVRAAAELSKVA
jgi:hypothetical protein